jgi:hypothetical protein
MTGHERTSVRQQVGRLCVCDDAHAAGRYGWEATAKHDRRGRSSYIARIKRNGEGDPEEEGKGEGEGAATFNIIAR